MEQQVVAAALAMIQPTTDSQTRSAASSFLEHWTRTPEAWEVYHSWLQSFHTSTVTTEDMGMPLLCLTLLQGKIRRDIYRTTSPSQTLLAIRQLLLELLDTSPSLLTNPLCACITAISARLGHVKEVVDMCTLSIPSTITITITTRTISAKQLKLLVALPTELEACGELTTPQVTAELWPHMERVLDTIRRALTMEEMTVMAALECLR